MERERQAGATPRSNRRMRTGVAGFDEISDGGLPRGGVSVVLGGAGSGKTIFGLQILASGARDFGEPGLLVAFEESADRLRANSADFTWGGAALQSTGVHFLDAQLPQAIAQDGDFDLVGFLAILSAKVKETSARRVVFDGIDVLLGNLGDPALIRRELFRVREWIHQHGGLSTIVTAKADVSERAHSGEFDILQFMADCLVTMHHRVVQGTALRFVRVSKYRGAAHSANEVPCTIGSAGLEVASSVSAERVHPVSSDRVTSGVARLDAMLSGGYHRGSSVLISGTPGTAKTSLGAAFAEAAARRGERTLLVSFDEAADQIVRNVASIGIDFSPHIEAGTLRIQSLRGRSGSPEAHVARIRGLMRELQPQNLIIDPISALTQRGCEAEAEAAVLQLLDLAKSAGSTILSTSLMGESPPLLEQTQYRVSTVADTWMHVSYVIRSGERNRALTIVKARGTGHSNQVRELILTGEGVTLADVYQVGGEVLMGTLRWERENEERRAQAAARTAARLRESKAALALDETKAQQEALARARALQEAELAQLRADLAAEGDHRAAQGDEILQRRRADPSLDSPTLAPTTASGPG